MLYSVNGIPVMEALAVQMKLALNTHFKLKWDYSEMRGFVRMGISLEIVISNTLILWIPRYKEVHIHQRLELTDVVVMSLLAP